MSDQARTWSELARTLRTTPKTLCKWKKRLPDQCPQDRDIAAWRRFLRENLRGAFSAQRGYGADESSPAASDARTGEANDILHWKTRHDELQCHRIARKIELEAAALVPSADLEIALGMMLVAFRSATDNFVERSAARVRGHTEFHAVAETLREECDGLLHGLYRADYLAPDILPGIIAAQPVPDGIRADQWREAIAAATETALRRIGRLALPK